MTSVIGVITARMASTRLPGKVLKPLAGKSMFAHHVERMKKIKGLDECYLATSVDPKNKPLIQEAEKLGCKWYAGPEEDIGERHIKICELESADAVIRVTCDCPLFNMDITEQFITSFKREYADFIYCGNMTMMQGTLTELISHNTLVRVHELYKGPAISLPIREHISKFNTRTINIDNDLIRPEYRLTVDETSDYTLINHIYNALYQGRPILLKDVYTWLDNNPDIAWINKNADIKGVNTYLANLMDKPLYSIVKSGDKYVILDSNKKIVDPDLFIETMLDLIGSEKILNVKFK